MVWYWLLFVLVLILLSVNNRQKSQWPLMISLLLIFLFFAFREGFTPDYESYKISFEQNYSQTMWTVGLHSNEPLYQLMTINMPYRLALIIQTFLVCMALYYTFKNTPRKFWWFGVIILFLVRSFLLGNMGAFRSAFVTVCFLLALISRESNESKKGTVFGCVLIGASALIHASGWVLLILYLLIGYKPLTSTKKKIWIVASVVLVIMSIFFANSLNSLLNLVFPDNEELEVYRYEKIENVMKFGTFTLLYLIMLIYLLFYTLKYSEKPELTKLEMNCVKITAIFFLINILPSIALKERFYYYLSLPSIIGATTIISKDKTTKGYIYCGLWLLYAFWSLYLFMDSPLYQSIYSHYRNVLFY